MIRLKIIFLSLIVVLFNCAGQNIVIKDTNFRRCLSTNYPNTVDINGDLIVSEAQKVTVLSCPVFNIVSLDELKYFSTLKELVVTKNAITTFPEFANPSIVTILYLGENAFESLPDFSIFPNLEVLSIQKLNLTRFPDVSKNIKLQELVVKSNLFDTIPPINLPDLEYLDVAATNLSHLPDFKNSKKLRQLDCYRNNISDLSGLTLFDSLKKLDATYNLIRNFPKLPLKIETIYLDNNLIDSLPSLNTYTKLKTIRLYNNQLTFKNLMPLTTYPSYQNIFKLVPQKLIKMGYAKSIAEKDSGSFFANIDLGISGIERKWYHNGVLTPITSSKYTIDTMSATDTGVYVSKLSNSLFPGLELSTDSFTVDMTPCINEKGVTWQITNANCTKQAAIDIKLSNQPKSNYNITLKACFTGRESTSTSGTFLNLSESCYQVIISGPENCKYTLKDSLSVSRVDCKDIVITPNADGIDDEYLFSQIGKAEVVDKWGNYLGEFTLPKLWDAKLNGKYIPIGNYIVVINNGSEALNLTVIY